MKLFVTLFVFLFLQGCTTLDTRTQSVESSVIPSIWNASGRIGVISQGQSQSLGFDIEFNHRAFDLTLIGALGLGQVSVKSTAQGLFINKVKTNLNLQQWMNQELGWYFPLEKLPNIVFQYQLSGNPNWTVEVSKFMKYENSYLAKVIKLKHQSQSIKIKLLLQEFSS